MGPRRAAVRQPTTDPYRACALCGHRCGVDRHVERGRCRTGAHAVLAAAVLHRGEEPPIDAGRGTGNLFFGRCSLRCVFCQNHGISQADRGRPVDAAALAAEMLALQRAGAGTLGLVTPSHVTPTVAAALRLARADGLALPVVHNGSAVDTADALALLDGLVDVYLPDLKWATAGAAERYSGAPWYPAVSRAAIRTMAHQVGPLTLDAGGRASRGLLVRHLVLPDDAAGTHDLLAWLRDAIGPCALSLLRQYTPLHHAAAHPPLTRPLTDAEYTEALDTAKWLGFDPIYTQDAASTDTGVPDWDDPSIFRW